MPLASLPAPSFALEPVTPQQYGVLREELLRPVPHIAYPLDALTYQAGCCALSGGGLYAAHTPHGTAVLCAEGMEDGSLLLKELLGTPSAQDALLAALPVLLPTFSGIYRGVGNEIPFGMLKLLSNRDESGWDWSLRSYLGLAFD